MGVDTKGGVVGPLRLWQREEGGIKLGGAYVVRGLKVVNDRAWDSTKGMWIRSGDAPKTIECNVRTACEDVEDVQSITQYLSAMYGRLSTPARGYILGYKVGGLTGLRNMLPLCEILIKI